ncbi:DUF6174 domain-containing protein [Teredinibacter turnerae]|uniref:DUF6174 domain-containing protein n=1 Tax=Teredinibacter turnerae TaxID=2426 RepID=UPI00036CA5B7|nr:DUF6174 domain-containing protein [Teredinibacter turnerae]
MRLAISILIASFVIQGCSFISVSNRDVDRSEEKWNALGIRDYSYTFVIASLNPEIECAPIGRGIKVEVKNGEVVRFGTCSIKVEKAKLYGTINVIFSTLRNEKDDAVSLKVSFHEFYGYPESIDINYSRWLTDHRVQYYIREFSVENE